MDLIGGQSRFSHAAFYDFSGGGGAGVGRFYASGLNTNKKSTSVSMANIPCYALLNKYLKF